MTVVNDRDQFFIISEIHDISARHSSNLHLPLENLDTRVSQMKTLNL